MYQATAYVYPTESERRNINGEREKVPGLVDLVVAYPAPEKKHGERTFTFAGYSPKIVRRMVALMRHGPRGAQIGNEMAAG